MPDQRFDCHLTAEYIQINNNNTLSSKHSRTNVDYYRNEQY